MKNSPGRIPIVARLILFLAGSACASLPIKAIYTGAFHVGGKTVPPFEISKTHEPVYFWSLVAAFLFISACMFYVCFARRLPNA
jgi:hypothetical protein